MRIARQAASEARAGRLPGDGPAAVLFLLRLELVEVRVVELVVEPLPRELGRRHAVALGARIGEEPLRLRQRLGESRREVPGLRHVLDEDGCRRDLVGLAESLVLERLQARLGRPRQPRMLDAESVQVARDRDRRVDPGREVAVAPVVGARVVGHRGEDDRHEAALVGERLEEVARRAPDVAPLGTRVGEGLQRELDVQRLALRRELVRLEPVPETAVGVPVGEHRGGYALGVTVLEQAGEKAALEHASGAVDQLASPLERSLRHARSLRSRRGPEARRLCAAAKRSIRFAMRSSRRVPGGSATTSAAPGTRRAPGPSSGGKARSPSVGQAGREQRVAELRLETVFPEERQAEVVEALRRAHPYEEPAFDVYALL